MQDPSRNVTINACFLPVCAGIIPILLPYTGNMEQLSLTDAILMMAASSLTSLLIFIVAGRFFKNLTEAALSTSFIVFVFFSHRHFVGMLSITGLNEGLGATENLLFSLFIMATGILYIRYRIRSHQDFLQVINLMAAVLLIISAGKIADFFLSPPYPRLLEAEELASVEISKPEGGFPDIYFIILDGYARNDTLKSLYNFDNSSFINKLVNQGFYIATKSNTNYIQTNLSLAGTLNLCYLDSLAAKIKDNSLGPTMSLISTNALSVILKRAGYETVAFESGYDITELQQADCYYSQSMISQQFLNLILSTTILNDIKFQIFNTTSIQAERHARLIRNTLIKIGKMKVKGAPKFVFAHILCPHPPFVFNSDGTLMDQEQSFEIRDGSHLSMDNAKYRLNYIKQLEYINIMVNNMLSDILKESERPKVIVLQSDHGPGSELDSESKQNTLLSERFGILNAIYFSDKNHSSLYQSISPVNTFRVVLNKYFATNLALLKDRHFYSTWNDRYKFIDVSDELNPAH